MIIKILKGGKIKKAGFKNGIVENGTSDSSALNFSGLLGSVTGISPARLREISMANL